MHAVGEGIQNHQKVNAYEIAAKKPCAGNVNI
jgi:hypothetical protein